MTTKYNPKEKPAHELYSPLIYESSRVLVYLIFNTLFRIEGKGSENIPKDHNFVLAQNHTYFFDPGFAMLHIKDHCFAVAMEKFFDKTAFPGKGLHTKAIRDFFCWYIPILGGYPVERFKEGHHYDFDNYLKKDPEFRQRLINHMQNVLYPNTENCPLQNVGDITTESFTKYLLLTGENVVWCPQGDVHRDSNLKDPKKGLAKLILEAAVDYDKIFNILPCSVEFPERLEPWKNCQQVIVKSKIGKEFTLEDYIDNFSSVREDQEKCKPILKEATEYIMSRIAKARNQ